MKWWWSGVKKQEAVQSHVPDREKVEVAKLRTDVALLQTQLDEIETVVEGLRQDSQKAKCIVCMEEEREALFLPCGHLVCCRKCAGKTKRKCPICRKSVHAQQRVYLA